MKVDRREVLCAAPAILLARQARAETPPLPPFPAGPLASNPVARLFTAAPPGLAFPDTTLLSRNRRQRVGDLRGRIHLISLWAEWCAPCLIEMADLAALHARYRGDKFGVLAILTDSGKKLDFDQADVLLRARGASLPLWIEPDGGASLINTLATQKGVKGGDLPCNLLVDAHGRIRGRAFGAQFTGKVDLPKSGILSEVDKRKLLSSSNVHTPWASPAAYTFVDALVGGAL